MNVAAFLLWIALDATIGAAMVAILAPVLGLAEWWAAARPGNVCPVFGIFFAGGWALQFRGHAIEGRRPVLVDNLFQASIGPMFIAAELLFALGLKCDLQARVEALAATPR
ncbi:MAG: DUF962 domain-containing protein [Alphaproteobacteria bacterium]|nr:DUF962 domain-containing protein [Alphaproteobacteria bacterium]